MRFGEKGEERRTVGDVEVLIRNFAFAEATADGLIEAAGRQGLRRMRLVHALEVRRWQPQITGAGVEQDREGGTAELDVDGIARAGLGGREHGIVGVEAGKEGLGAGRAAAGLLQLEGGGSRSGSEGMSFACRRS